MDAGGDALEDDPLIAQLCEELPDLANAREATAAFTFDPSAQYVAPAPLGGVMPGHVNVMQQPGLLPLPVPSGMPGFATMLPNYGAMQSNMMPPMPPPMPPPQFAMQQQQQQQQPATSSSGLWSGAAAAPLRDRFRRR